MLQTTIGKVDEVLGPINQVYFTIKPQEGIVATSFKAGDKFYIGGDKLLPLEKYVHQTVDCTSRLLTNAAQIPTETKTAAWRSETKTCRWWISRWTNARRERGSSR